MNNQPWTQWTGKKIMLPMRACYRCNTFFEVSEPSKKFCDYCSEHMMKIDTVFTSGKHTDVQMFIHHQDKATDCTRRFS